MTQHDALLTAVCAAPDDDLPRLVYADWCDENDNPDRAEFIRTQIELTHETTRKRRAALQKREQELLAEHRAAWTEPFEEFTDDFREDPIRFRRGFVEAISINDELLDEHGDELFASAPIRTLLMGDQDGFGGLHKCQHLLRISTLDLAVSSLDSGRGSPKLFGSKYLSNLTTLIATGYDDNGHLDLAGLEAIGTSPSLTKLRHLDISDNWLFGVAEEVAGDFAILQTLDRLPALTGLSVAGTGLGGHVVPLAQESWLRRLRLLDLRSNRINDTDARAFAASPHLDSIEQLDLSDNHVWDDGETAMSDEVKRLLKQRFGKRVMV